MGSRPESDEALVRRLLPSANPDPADRISAWSEWQARIGSPSVLSYIRFSNNTTELDEDIFQDAMLTAFIEVERGRYEHREGVPFTAYVKGIAHNKIREARRRERGWTSLDDLSQVSLDGYQRILESTVERQEQRREFVQKLSKLPAARRQVLERFIQGESTREIARVLSMSEELVRQHKSRGLRSLRQMSAGD